MRLETKSVAVRTCVGCHELDDSGCMLRFVLHGDRVIADPTRVAFGRGAWLHASTKCVQLASRRHGFDRSFRKKVQFDPNQVSFGTCSGSQSADRCLADESGLEADGHPMSSQR